MKMTNGNYNNIKDISTDNLYKLLKRAKKSKGDYVAQIQCIETELIFRTNDNWIIKKTPYNQMFKEDI